MGTFNAGAVEASLTLDRSDWITGLRQTKKDIEDLENTSITIGIDLADDDIKAELDRLSAALEKFEEKTINPGIELDTKFIEEQLAWLEGEFDWLDARRVNIAVDVDADNAIIGLDNLESNYIDPLDRDPVVVEVRVDVNDRELDALERRLERLERKRYTVNMNLDSDALIGDLSAVEGILEGIDGRTLNIDAELDTGAVIGELAALESLVVGFTDLNIDTDLDSTRALGEMAALEALVLGFPDLNIDVDYNRSAMRGLVGAAGGDGSGGSMGLLRILIYAIILLSPILIVALSAMSAAIVAFAAALVAALGPAIIVAGGLVGLIQRFNDTEPKDYSPGMKAFADSIESVKDAWEQTLDLAEKSGAFELMADALEMVADILPTLNPLFDATVDMLGDVLDGVKGFVNSSEYDEMLGFFAGFGVDMLRKFLKIGGDLLKFFGRLFQAIAPFARQMMNGLRQTTMGWAEWADDLENNDGFQRWVSQALEYGPMLFDMLGSLWDALMNISEALRPFAGPMLKALTWFFDVIADLDTDQLTMLIGALAGLWLGLNVLVPLVGAIITGVELLAAGIAFLLSPIGLIVLAIAGLIAVFVYLWKTNEDFRDMIITTWEEIVQFLEPIIQDIVDFIMDNWGPMKEWVITMWDDIKHIVFDFVQVVTQLIRGLVRVISFVWNTWGEDFMRIAKGAAQVVGSILRGLVGIIRGIFEILSGILTGNWGKAWEGVKRIFRSAIDMITGVLRGLGNFWGGLFNGIAKAITGVWNQAMQGLRDAWNAFKKWIDDKFKDLTQKFLGVRINPGQMWDGIKEAFRGVINDIIGWWNNLSLSVDIPDAIPGLPDSFTVSTPNIQPLAKGGYVTDPILALIGEDVDNEVVAPEPVLERIVRENSGSNLDYGRLAAAIVYAIQQIPGLGGVTAEDLERLIEAASVNLNIDARSEGDRAEDFAQALAFELKVLGYGGKEAA